jgi:hypothetical protein
MHACPKIDTVLCMFYVGESKDVVWCWEGMYDGTDEFLSFKGMVVIQV